MIDIDKIRGRAEKATKGPWSVNYGDINLTHFEVITPATHEDGLFINHAREDIPALCSELARVLAALEEMVAQHCSYGGMASSGKFFELSSTGLSANRDAMRLLEEYGRLEIGDSAGKVVLANWTKKEDVKT